MDEKRESQIVGKYPEFFPCFRGDPAKTCLAWGLAIGDGWADLFDKLCADIKALNPSPDFRFEQVKEKFGGLRAYWSGGGDACEAIQVLVDAAEEMSFRVCEGCGTTEGVTVEGGWIKALCPACRRPA